MSRAHPLFLVLKEIIIIIPEILFDTEYIDLTTKTI